MAQQIYNLFRNIPKGGDPPQGEQWALDFVSDDGFFIDLPGEIILPGDWWIEVPVTHTSTQYQFGVNTGSNYYYNVTTSAATFRAGDTNNIVWNGPVGTSAYGDVMRVTKDTIGGVFNLTRNGVFVTDAPIGLHVGDYKFDQFMKLSGAGFSRSGTFVWAAASNGSKYMVQNDSTEAGVVRDINGVFGDGIIIGTPPQISIPLFPADRLVGLMNPTSSIIFSTGGMGFPKTSVLNLSVNLKFYLQDAVIEQQFLSVRGTDTAPNDRSLNFTVNSFAGGGQNRFICTTRINNDSPGPARSLADNTVAVETGVLYDLSITTGAAGEPTSMDLNGVAGIVPLGGQSRLINGTNTALTSSSMVRNNDDEASGGSAFPPKDGVVTELIVNGTTYNFVNSWAGMTLGTALVEVESFDGGVTWEPTA